MASVMGAARIGVRSWHSFGLAPKTGTRRLFGLVLGVGVFLANPEDIELQHCCSFIVRSVETVASEFFS